MVSSCLELKRWEFGGRALDEKSKTAAKIILEYPIKLRIN